MENKFEADFGQTIEIEKEIRDELKKKSEKSTCKIMILLNEKPLNGTAFFAKFKNLNKIFLFTNNHILNENEIKPENTIKCNYMNELKKFKMKDRLCFTNTQLDYTCFEIKKEDQIKDYFEIEDQEENQNNEYDAEDIALAHYPNGGPLQIIAGHLINIEGYYIRHLVTTNEGSSGSPIILLLRKNYKVLGIHSQISLTQKVNLGINMKNIYEDIKKKLYEKKEIENQIKFDYQKYQSLLSKCYSENDNIIGIDLGIMNCCVGIKKNGKVIIINDINNGEKMIPSIVCCRNDDVLIGKAAKDNMLQRPESIMFNSKRLIGHKFNDPQIQNYIKKWPMKIIEDPLTKKPQYVIRVNNKEKKFFPEEVTSLILKYLKNNAEKFNNTKINKAVITVPIYYNNEQREIIIKAAKSVGLEIIKIISEPIACAIACNQFSIKEKKVLIFYFGNGTLNISIIKIKENEYFILASCGEEYFSEDDFNEKLEKYIIEEIKKKNEFKNIDFQNQNDKNIKNILKKIKRRLDQIVIDLKILNSTLFYVDSLYDNQNFELKIEKAKYEEICKDLWMKCLDKIDEALKKTQLQKKEIDEIILAGDSIKNPKINEMIKKYFNGKEPLNQKNYDEIITYGATLSPYLNLKIKNILKEGIGIEVSNGKMHTIIPSGIIIPFIEYKYRTKNQNSNIKFKIYMGNSDYVCQNNFLGKFEVKNNDFKEKNINIIMFLNYNSILKVIPEINNIRKIEFDLPVPL